LLKASENAAESNLNKDEFIAVLSHELRGPVASIRLIADALSRRPLLEEKLDVNTQRLVRQTEAITRIIDDIRDLSRLSHRKVSIEREDLDLGDLLREAAEDCSERMNASKLVASIETPGEPVIVFSDRLRLKQIFDNLLSNAIKFTEDGGTVGVRLKTDGNDVIVEISDSGRGFDAAIKEAIFEPFVQAGQSVSHEQSGMGLGLAISRQLVELLGGGIVAESDGAGKGSTFTVRMPR
jgi:signal transduction histidine kinase